MFLDHKCGAYFYRSFKCLPTILRRHPYINVVLDIGTLIICIGMLKRSLDNSERV